MSNATSQEEYERILRQIERAKRHLTAQQYRTLVGQVMAGDVLGARKGLNKLINRPRKERNHDEQ